MTALPIILRAGWRASPVSPETAGQRLCARGAPADWGRPIEAGYWESPDGLSTLLVAAYANGRVAKLRSSGRSFALSMVRS